MNDHIVGIPNLKVEVKLKTGERGFYQAFMAVCTEKDFIFHALKAGGGFYCESEKIKLTLKYYTYIAVDGEPVYEDYEGVYLEDKGK